MECSVLAYNTILTYFIQYFNHHLWHHHVVLQDMTTRAIGLTVRGPICRYTFPRPSVARRQSTTSQAILMCSSTLAVSTWTRGTVLSWKHCQCSSTHDCIAHQHHEVSGLFLPGLLMPIQTQHHSDKHTIHGMDHYFSSNLQFLHFTEKCTQTSKHIRQQIALNLPMDNKDQSFMHAELNKLGRFTVHSVWQAHWQYSRWFCEQQCSGMKITEHFRQLCLTWQPTLTEIISGR